MSTKIHATVDALGNPLGFHLTPGQACDLDGADQLLPELLADTVIADKAYDADERVIERLEAQGKTAVIPPRRNRTHPRAYDKDLYKARHLPHELFRQTQAVSSNCHTLRQTRGQLSGCDLPRCFRHLAQLMTRPSVFIPLTRKGCGLSLHLGC